MRWLEVAGKSRDQGWSYYSYLTSAAALPGESGGTPFAPGNGSFSLAERTVNRDTPDFVNNRCWPSSGRARHRRIDLNVGLKVGETAQLLQSSLPEEVVAVQKLIRSIVQRMEASIANHEFEKARFYSGEERIERDHLQQLRKQYRLDENPAYNVRSEDIEKAVSKLTGMSVAAIRQSRTANPSD